MMKKRLSKTLWYGSDVDSEGNPIIPSAAKSVNDLEGLHYGELYIHLSEQITLWSVAKNGEVQQIAGGDKVDLSGYLLKSIWDKVWEIRTDSTGKEYIFGKLPVVTQYGITMYAGDGGDIDLPSLYAGLPIDNTTIYWENGVLKAVGSSGGGGVADSVAWANVYGKPSWITDAKPTYAYSEITGTPDLTKYALKSDIPSLSGYATEQWVIGKGYALDADLDALSVIVGNKADKTELAKYIPISGYTEVSGEKNFTGGLKVNGSPIYYDTEKKYWKLEGDLLVTGGVTMYANEGTYTPSTIMDALLYDDTTLGINSEGKLYVKGGTGGGLDITALQNYLTQNSYLNVTEGDGRYLKLSGGILNGDVYFGDDSSGANTIGQGTTFPSHIYRNVFDNSGNVYDHYYNRVYGNSTYTYANLRVKNGTSFQILRFGGDGSFTWAGNRIWHEGNLNPSNYLLASSYTAADVLAKLKTVDGSGSGLDADLLDGYNSDDFTKTLISGIDNFLNATDKVRFQAAYVSGQGDFCSLVIPTWTGNSSSNWYLTEVRFVNAGTPKLRLSNKGTVTTDWREFAFTDSNVASATKLQTARTIWGQSFDGTGNVSGNLNLSYNKLYIGDGSDNYFIGWGTNNCYVYQNYYGHYFTTKGERRMTIDGSGNVGIGTPSPAQKLHIDGVTLSKAYIANTCNRSLIISSSSYTWGGITNAYPLIWTEPNTGTDTGDRFTMIAFPHIPFLKNGVRGYNGTTFGSIVRFESDATTTATSWDIGCTQADAFFIRRGTVNTFSIGSNGLSAFYTPNQWLSNSMIVMGRTDTSVASSTYAQIGVTDGNLHIDAYKGYGIYLNFYQNNTGVIIDKDCNLLVSGGVTFYSQKSLKNIQDERGLSLKEMSIIKPTRYTWKDGRDNRIHFGGIADDIQQVLPEVVYKTNEGILTMDYGNAAFAVASSLIKPVISHEAKITMLQQRIEELEEEVERLKAN